MKLVLLALVLLTFESVNAENRVCDPVASRGEGHWPIAETEFTKDRAAEAVARLQTEVQDGTAGVDFVSLETEMLYIKGYLLRASAASGNAQLVSDFCKFIEREAYVRH